MDSMTMIKEFKVPTQVLSSTLHPDKSVFVCGGEDFKMYKYDFHNGNEIGLTSIPIVSIISKNCRILESFKGHFGGVHCVRFSPDGELYASGSEDGTLRLWQTTVGKTYGLWKCTNPNESEPIDQISNNENQNNANK